MKKTKLFAIALMPIMILFVFSCSGNKQKAEVAPVNEDTAVIDMHTAENALDYPGVYKGRLWENNKGINVKLTLGTDNTFTLESEAKTNDKPDLYESGNYAIDGNYISLETKDQPTRYLKVEEGRVRLVDRYKQILKGELDSDNVLLAVEEN